jgi:membrane-bound serine protease (ClpP class)
MSSVILIFLAGIAMLGADIFASSFVLAVLGTLTMLAGSAVAYQNFGPLPATLTAAAAFLLLGVTVYLELVWLPKTRFGRGLVVHSVVDATSQPPVADNAVVGKSAEALTTLAPSGYVSVEGKRYEAFSQSGHAPKGATLRVVGLDNFRLIVTKT